MEVLERLGTPLEELVALAVPLELELRVLIDGVDPVEEIHLDGVIDYEIHRKPRIDFGRVTAETGHGTPHGGQIDHRGHPGEILKQYPRRFEGNLNVSRTLRIVLRQLGNVVRGDRALVLAGCVANDGL